LNTRVEFRSSFRQNTPCRVGWTLRVELFILSTLSSRVLYRLCSVQFYKLFRLPFCTRCIEFCWHWL